MSNPVCMLHTTRPATALCTECGRPLCQECTLLVANKPVCQNCLAAIRSRVATQLNAEAGSAPTAPPFAPQSLNQPYTPSGGYASPAGQPPVAPSYTGGRTDLAGNVYNPPPGSQYSPPQPYGAPHGAPPNPAYPPQQQQPGFNPQAPYGAQPGYGVPPQPSGQPGYGQPAAPGQPGYNPSGYNPYGAGQPPYPPQQPGYPPAQAPYGTPPQAYPGQNPYAGQQGSPLSPSQASIGVGNYFLGVIFGLGAAILGAILYVWVIYVTNMSIGYMALGVGFMVGWAVKLGTRMPSQGAGIIAVALTVLAILPVRLLLGHSTTNLLFTLLFLFIGCRWAYGIAAGTR